MRRLTQIKQRRTSGARDPRVEIVPTASLFANALAGLAGEARSTRD
jgi:hypothetical protein